MLEYFTKNAEEVESRNIWGGLWQHLNYFVLEIEKLFKQQGIVFPCFWHLTDVCFGSMFIKLYESLFKGKLV